MKKKNGFSLIELLAVIIIMSFIVLITAPVIVNIISDTQEKSFKTTAHGMLNAAELFYTNKLMGQTDSEVVFEFDEGSETTLPETYGKLEFKGERPQKGKVVVKNNGQIGIAIYDGVYCAVKNFDSSNDEEEIVMYEEKTDEQCLAMIDEPEEE